MNTITFYSYKGGVGRTLALANVARYLAQLGKRVVCADFDFEAPGLHYKFGVTSESIEAGMVDVVAEFISKGRIRSIADLAIEVEVEHSRGSVHLLTAGCAPHPNYWTTLGGIDWHRLFLGQERDLPSGTELFLEIQEQVEESLKPDYFLIDARTGITEVGGIALSLLADSVVCILAHNLENLDGARAVLRSLRATPRIDDERSKILPVLSRIPANLDPKEERDLLESVQVHLNEPAEEGGESLDLEHLLVLHSEPRLQVHEALKVPDAGTVEESALLRDYLDLFRVLIPKEDVVSGLAPLLEREQKRAFEDPDTAQGRLESLAFLYPTRETALALLQLYVLRNLSADRVIGVAKRLFTVSGDAAEPILGSILEEHVTQLESDDLDGFRMATEVWKAQATSNNRLATELVKSLPESLPIDPFADLGIRQSLRPDPALVKAVIERLVSRGAAQDAVDLAAELMPDLAKNSEFLEARVAAVVELGDQETANHLVDELESVQERLSKSTWNRLQKVAGNSSAASVGLGEGVDDVIRKVERRHYGQL